MRKEIFDEVQEMIIFAYFSSILTNNELIVFENADLLKDSKTGFYEVKISKFRPKLFFHFVISL